MHASPKLKALVASLVLVVVSVGVSAGLVFGTERAKKQKKLAENITYVQNLQKDFDLARLKLLNDNNLARYAEVVNHVTQEPQANTAAYVAPTASTPSVKPTKKPKTSRPTKTS